MASEKFELIISQYILSCSGAYDIMVVGKAEVDHDAKLTKVTQSLIKRGLIVIRGKCQIKMMSMKYKGLYIDARESENLGRKIESCGQYRLHQEKLH